MPWDWNILYPTSPFLDPVPLLISGTLSGDYVGHDWFVSTVFLMMYGDPDLAWEFLFKCSSLVSSGYLWVRRLHASVRKHFKTAVTP